MGASVLNVKVFIRVNWEYTASALSAKPTYTPYASKSNPVIESGSSDKTRQGKVKGSRGPARKILLACSLVVGLQLKQGFHGLREITRELEGHYGGGNVFPPLN